MIVFKSIKEWLEFRKTVDNHSLGFVPTMGALHHGHGSLIKQSLSENSLTAVSVFVNKQQFNNPLDYVKYPKDDNADLEILDKLNVSYVLLPEHHDIYPDDLNYQIIESNLSAIMEGRHRPGHFNGVLTVVMKLLNIIKPTIVYFGEKDYQQALLIQNMINAFFIDTKITICPTIRDCNGLALSSRNKLLTKSAKSKAYLFHRVLNSNQTSQEIITELESYGFKVEYIKDYKGRRYAAVQLEGVRLIDNVPRKEIQV